MIWLLMAVAFADPCAREAVVGRGLVVEPGETAGVLAELELTLKLVKRRVDGIPSYSVKHAWLDWTWTVQSEVEAEAWSAVGSGGALCEGEVEAETRFAVEPGVNRPHRLRYAAKKLDACRVRVVLKGTIPSTPTVRLKVLGPDAPGPEAPESGAYTVTGGQDLVIDVPGCL